MSPLLAEFALSHAGSIVHRGSETFIDADVVPQLLDEVERRGVRLLGLEGSLIGDEDIFPALSRIADFSYVVTPLEAVTLARELLAGAWRSAPTPQDQMHMSAVGRHMIAFVLGDG